jgi:hypothetical protein
MLHLSAERLLVATCSMMSRLGAVVARNTRGPQFRET